MTRIEFRASQGYKDAIAKIESYSKGFEFTLPYGKMTQGQRNALFIITRDAIDRGLIESKWIGASLTDAFNEEHFVRL